MGFDNQFRSPPAARQARLARWGDLVFGSITLIGALALFALLIALIWVLYYGGKATFVQFGLAFLYTTEWDPVTQVFGVAPWIVGTLISSALALVIAVPLSLGAAIFLTQQAPDWLRGPVGQVIELLAAIPSVIFGFWALVVLVPIMRNNVEPFLATYFGWTGWFGGNPIGLDLLTAGVVLSIMAVPTITAIARDSIAAVPQSQKEAALSLGATEWEVTRRAVVPYAGNGIIAGIVLGLGRALGETMAVTLVIGNRNALPDSLFSQAQTIASGIANEFTEASGPSEYSALIAAGLVLLLITLLINVVARVVLVRFQRNRGVGLE